MLFENDGTTYDGKPRRARRITRVTKVTKEQPLISEPYSNGFGNDCLLWECPLTRRVSFSKQA